MKDKGTHRAIRLNLLEQISEERHPWSSHEGLGDISFFNVVDGMRIHVAEPDIVVEGGNEVLIIEVELSNQPKRLLGVAFAIWMASVGTFGNREIKLNKKSLMIVMDQGKMKSHSRRSGKPDQWKGIEKAVRSTLDFAEFSIAFQEDANAKLKEWLRSRT